MCAKNIDEYHKYFAVMHKRLNQPINDLEDLKTIKVVAVTCFFHSFHFRRLRMICCWSVDDCKRHVRQKSNVSGYPFPPRDFQT